MSPVTQAAMQESPCASVSLPSVSSAGIKDLCSHTQFARAGEPTQAALHAKQELSQLSLKSATTQPRPHCLSESMNWIPPASLISLYYISPATFLGTCQQALGSQTPRGRPSGTICGWWWGGCLSGKRPPAPGSLLLGVSLLLGPRLKECLLILTLAESQI